MSDPFAEPPGATPADYDIQPRRWGVEPKPCELVGKPKRKKVDLSPMQRRWFESGGWTYARVEHANAFGAVTVDLWGFADWLAVRGDETLLVQTTTHSHAAARLRKSQAIPELAAWLGGGGRRFVVHGWHQPGGPGTRWELIEREVTP